jgi:hypothetical protein
MTVCAHKEKRSACRTVAAEMTCTAQGAPQNNPCAWFCVCSRHALRMCTKETLIHLPAPCWSANEEKSRSSQLFMRLFLHAEMTRAAPAWSCVLRPYALRLRACALQTHPWTNAHAQTPTNNRCGCLVLCAQTTCAAPAHRNTTPGPAHMRRHNTIHLPLVLWAQMTRAAPAHTINRRCACLFMLLR